MSATNGRDVSIIFVLLLMFSLFSFFLYLISENLLESVGSRSRRLECGNWKLLLLYIPHRAVLKERVGLIYFTCGSNNSSVGLRKLNGGYTITGNISGSGWFVYALRQV